MLFKITKSKGYQQYIVTDGGHQIVGLDEDRIAEDVQCDGYLGIQTSEISLAATVVIDDYQKLQKIEDSFRVLKSTVQTRPNFHWTEKRMKDHFVACFMVFVLERALENKLNANEIDASPGAIKEAIQQMGNSEMVLQGYRYYLKAMHLPTACNILNVLRINHLRIISSKEVTVA